MLWFYFSTVIIFAIIILCVGRVFKDKFKENSTYIYGENSSKSKLTGRLLNLIVLSAVPILRLIVVGGIVFIVTAKKETLDELKKCKN